MARNSPPERPLTEAERRAERLKAALKSNMGRRKAQARARSDNDRDADPQRGSDPQGSERED
jgi:hypothetical protein